MAGLAFIGGVAGLVASVIARGYVLSVLWGWFLVPLGLTPIGKAHALGVALVAGMLAGTQSSKSSDGGGGASAFIAGLAVSILTPFFCLAFGWLIQLFM